MLASVTYLPDKYRFQFQKSQLNTNVSDYYNITKHETAIFLY